MILINSAGDRLQDNFPPALLTKHHERRFAKSTRHGVLNAGTLVGYRGGENAVMRVSDSSEGKIEHLLQVPEKQFVSARIENAATKQCFQISNAVFDGCRDPIKLTTQFNELCLCFSIGGYSASRHRNLRYGTLGYQGDPRLSNYTVFNTDLLLEGLFDWVKGKWGRESRSRQFEIIAGVVTYQDKVNRLPVDGEVDLKINTSAMQVLQSAFRKPEAFSPEEEFRILIRPFAPKSCPRDFPSYLTDRGPIEGAVVDAGAMRGKRAFRP